MNDLLAKEAEMAGARGELDELRAVLEARRDEHNRVVEEAKEDAREAARAIAAAAAKPADAVGMSARKGLNDGSGGDDDGGGGGGESTREEGAPADGGGAFGGTRHDPPHVVVAGATSRAERLAEKQAAWREEKE